MSNRNKTRKSPQSTPIPDPNLTRRELLKGGAAIWTTATVGAKLAACASDDAPETMSGPEDLFQHGVSSGDPLPDAVILWTRVTPAQGDPVDVRWEVSETPDFDVLAQSGTFTTDKDRDFTVKVDATSLSPGQTYYYRFAALGRVSAVGRTRTAPEGPSERLRFAVTSCASYPHGYFHAYGAIAQRADLDAVIHLGDYIYEYGEGEYGDVRGSEPTHELLSLADYRTRHAQYKRDAQLQAAHRQHPFILIWDDHETVNNAWKDGAVDHDPATEGDFEDRKAAALQAYFEWMPIREQDQFGQIWRTLRFGDLVDLVLLDSRLWGRDETSGEVAVPRPALDPERTLLGDDQAEWMEDQLSRSNARWKLVCQQVMVGNLNLSEELIANPDQWHGYPSARARLINFLRDSDVDNVVILTGDIHSSWANEIAIDPNDSEEYDPSTGTGSAAVEFVTPSVTSPGLGDYADLVEMALPFNPHVKYFDLERHGYVLLDVTEARVQSAWYLFESVEDDEEQTETFAAAWSANAGTTQLEEDEEPAPTPTGAPSLAP